MSPIPHLATPPGAPSTPYVLPCYTGELWTIPTSNSTMRLLVTGKETSNAFAVVGTGGTFDQPIGFHYHKEAHDVFLCVKGKINVWADDRARTLGPGDFASVPPNTIHRYQIDSFHTEFLGLIIPGGWEEFFRFVGEPYAGPLFPTNDRRNPFKVLVPKLIAATEKFDMIPVRDKAHFDPQAWDGSEKILPGTCEKGGYFLKDGEGEKWVVGGTVVRALARRQESDGRFSIYEVLCSGSQEEKEFGGVLRFEETHHAVYTVEGLIKLVIDGNESTTTAGETTFVPAGTEWRFQAESVYACAYIFANGGGLGEILTRLGSKYESAAVPQPGEEVPWSENQLKGLEADLKFTVV